MSNPVNKIVSALTENPHPLVKLTVDKENFNIRQSQAKHYQTNTKDVIVQPATTVSSTWSVQPVTFNIPRTALDRLNDMDLSIKVTGSGSGVVLLPSPLFIDYVEFDLGPNAKIRKTGDDMYIDFVQTLAQDEIDVLRLSMNMAATYAHNSLPGTASSYIHVPLGRLCFIRQTGPLMLPALVNEIRVTVVFKAFATAAVSGASGDLAVNAITLNLNGEILPKNIKDYEMSKWRNTIYLKYLDTICFQKVVGSETSGSTYQHTLGGVSGLVPYINMFWRDSGALTGAGQYDLRPIVDYQINNGAGTNIIGGSPVLSDYSRYVIWPRYWRSNASNALEIYTHSWCVAPKLAYDVAGVSGTEQFDNNYVIKYTAGDSDTHELNVFAKVYAVLKLQNGQFEILRSN